MNQKRSIELKAILGFFLGGTVLSLYILCDTSISSLRDSYYWPILLFLALAASGAIGGVSLSDKQEGHRSRLLDAFGFSIGFVIGGGIVCVSILLLWLYTGNSGHFELKEFLGIFWIFVAGFSVAGILSAAMTRTRRLSVISGALSFSIGGVAGGAVIGVILKMDWHSEVAAAVAGVLVSYTVGGGICGMLLKDRESS